jgi:hypothetical protein
MPADEGWSVRQTVDGGYIVAGHTYSFGAGVRDVYFVKTDQYGDTVWTRAYGGAGQEYAYSVRQTADGGYIVAGRTKSSGGHGSDVYVVRTDGDGDVVWTAVYGRWTGDDVARSVRQTIDGGYIVAGYTGTIGAGSTDVYLMKFDPSGDTSWTVICGGTGGDYGYCVEQVADGGYVVAGRTESFGAGGADAYLVRTDANGDTLWTRTCGGPGDDEARSVQLTSSGGFIIAGTRFSSGTGDDVFLVRVDSLGEVVWSATCGGAEADRGFCVEPVDGGGYVVAGETESFGLGRPYRPDVYLVRVGPAGDTMWTMTLGDTWYDYGRSVQQTVDGGYVVAGYMDVSRGCQDYDVYLAVLEPEAGVSGSAVVVAGRGVLGVGPEPFCDRAVIQYAVCSPGHVRVVIADALGREVVVLVDGRRAAGRYEVVWDGTDARSRAVAGGVYVCSLESGSEPVRTRRLTLLR